MLPVQVSPVVGCDDGSPSLPRPGGGCERAPGQRRLLGVGLEDEGLDPLDTGGRLPLDVIEESLDSVQSNMTGTSLQTPRVRACLTTTLGPDLARLLPSGLLPPVPSGGLQIREEGISIRT